MKKDLHIGMYYKKFNYNPFCFSFTSIGRFTNILLIALLTVGAILGEVYLKWYLYSFACYAFVLILGFVISKMHGLTIDDKGISMHYPFRGKYFASWNEIGGYRKWVTCYDGRKQLRGIGLVGKDVSPNQSLPLSIESGSYVLFIPFRLITDTNLEITRAVENGINYYVHQRSLAELQIEVSTNHTKKIIVLIFLFLIWFVINYYRIDLSNSLRPDIYFDLMYYTLDGNHLYQYGISAIMGMRIILAILFFGMFFPYLLARKDCKIGTICFTILIALTLLEMKVTIPKKERILQNCSGLVFHSPDTINTTVSYVTSEDSRSSYVKFEMKYEDKNYEIEMEYVRGAKVDMPVVVIVQKGSQNIPVITQIEIAERKWEDYQLDQRFWKYCQHDLRFYWKKDILGNALNMEANSNIKERQKQDGNVKYKEKEQRKQ